MHNGYVRHPDAFDPTAYAQEHDRAHTTAPGHFYVTATSHPALFETFEAISADNCGGAGHVSYSVPDALTDRATLGEAFLSRLSREDRETVGCGEYDDQLAVMTRYARDDEERENVNGFLNLFFEDWHGVE